MGGALVCMDLAMGRTMVRYRRSLNVTPFVLMSVMFVTLLLQSPAQSQANNVRKSGPDQVLVGQNFTYTISAVNDANPGVLVSDVLDPGVDLNGPLPTGCTSVEANNIVTITCNLPNIAANAQVSLNLNVEAPNTVGQIDNEAVVDSTRSNTVTTTVVPAADIQIVKEANPNPVDLGDNLTFTLNVINRGPSEAPFVRIRDDLPGNVILISVDENEGDDCTIRPGQIIECDFRSLAPGEGRSVLVTVEPEEAGTVTNTARVIRGTIGVVDPNNANNIDTVSVTVEDENADGGTTGGTGGETTSGTTAPSGSTTPSGGGSTMLSGEETEVTVIQGVTIIKESIPGGKTLPSTGGAENEASTAGRFLGVGFAFLLGAVVIRLAKFRIR